MAEVRVASKVEVKHPARSRQLRATSGCEVNWRQVCPALDNVSFAQQSLSVFGDGSHATGPEERLEPADAPGAFTRVTSPTDSPTQQSTRVAYTGSRRSRPNSDQFRLVRRTGFDGGLIVRAFDAFRSVESSPASTQIGRRPEEKEMICLGAQSTALSKQGAMSCIFKSFQSKLVIA